MKMEQDWFSLIRIRAPSANEVRQRIIDMPVRMIAQSEDLQLILQVGELDGDYGNAFRSFSPDSPSFPLFVHIFGNPKYLEKIQKLPVLTQSDKEALRVAELNLTNLILKRIPRPKYLDKPPRPAAPEKRRPPTEEEAWDRIRINAGTYGYREIAKKLRRFLELESISITPEDRAKMREIFRRPQKGPPYVGAPIDSNAWLKQLIVDEFQGRLRSASDWKRLFNDPNPNVARYARYRYDIHSGFRKPLPYSAKLESARQRVLDLEQLVLEQPITTAQYWELQDILKGDWPAAAAREFGEFGNLFACQVCGKVAGYACEECPVETLYCGPVCQKIDWTRESHILFHP